MLFMKLSTCIIISLLVLTVGRYILTLLHLTFATFLNLLYNMFTFIVKNDSYARGGKILHGVKKLKEDF